MTTEAGSGQGTAAAGRAFAGWVQEACRLFYEAEARLQQQEAAVEAAFRQKTEAAAAAAAAEGEAAQALRQRVVADRQVAWKALTGAGHDRLTRVEPAAPVSGVPQDLPAARSRAAEVRELQERIIQQLAELADLAKSRAATLRLLLIGGGAVLLLAAVLYLTQRTALPGTLAGAAAPGPKAPAEVEPLKGRWEGRFDDDGSIMVLTVAADGSALLSVGGAVQERLAVSRQGGTYHLVGTSVTPYCGGMDAYPYAKDTLTGTLSSDGTSMSGTYKDEKGNSGHWTLVRAAMPGRLTGDWQGSYNGTAQHLTRFEGHLDHVGSLVHGCVSDIGSDGSREPAVVRGTLHDTLRVVKRYYRGLEPIDYEGQVAADDSLSGRWKIGDSAYRGTWEMSRR